LVKTKKVTPNGLSLDQDKEEKLNRLTHYEKLTVKTTPKVKNCWKVGVLAGKKGV